MSTSYYRMVSKYKGHHYFKVVDNQENVVKVTFGAQPKAGRPFCPGITLIKYTTFISSYGWKMEDPTYNRDITKITKKEYDQAFGICLKKLMLYESD